MDNDGDLFHPSLAAALLKLDPEDGEQILEYFRTHALLSREKALLQASVRDQRKLLVENGKLKKDIEQLRVQLHEKQRRRTAKALLSPAPPPPTLSPASATPASQPAPPTGAAVTTSPPPPSSASCERRERQGRRRRARPTSDALSLGAEPRLDVSRLDLRVGRVLSVRRHPLAETLSVQEVDVGENAPRTVVSRLGEKRDLEELRDGLAVLLCNVKACKLRGVVSQARILCCSASSSSSDDDDCIELLAPPTGSAPGDRVTFLNYPGDADRELQSKQRVWELLQPDLQVDCRGVANYKGCGFEVKGKGLCRAPSLANCIIR
ncbi:aminoacyl tRNA synthase complex-interacting multifunctional protein 1-like isoform X2 [Scophthalmus maximus]|uniref:aminoacyl tRNA synthase complex-interacting multifunctional protein 1-like isoform X2 n=1 Tax=Scophthalmus maximus TaxID=52904 RepID=UPI001FA91B28|nr:aminoacyl tRNA synthase complex-interacting multifunctional protein 1-like isoform X2 [Scophthalmus maximus]